MVASPVRHRFTAEEYERMAEAGILDENVWVESIAGEIVAMSPIGDRHVGGVNRTNPELVRQAGDDVTGSVQNPIRLGPPDEPLPDLAVLRGAGRGLADAADLLLAMEIADSSRGYDRNLKPPRYAAAGIPEAWLVDLVAGIIERHTDPQDGAYRQVVSVRRGESPASTVLPTLVVDVDAIPG